MFVYLPPLLACKKDGGWNSEVKTTLFAAFKDSPMFSNLHTRSYNTAIVPLHPDKNSSIVENGHFPPNTYCLLEFEGILRRRKHTCCWRFGRRFKRTNGLMRTSWRQCSTTGFDFRFGLKSSVGVPPFGFHIQQSIRSFRWVFWTERHLSFSCAACFAWGQTICKQFFFCV